MKCDCEKNQGSSENLVPLRMFKKLTLTYAAAQTTAARETIELPKGVKAYALNISNAPVYAGTETFAVVAIDSPLKPLEEQTELKAGRGVILDNQQGHDHALAGDAGRVTIDLAAKVKADATDGSATITITIYELGPTEKVCK